MIGQSVSNRYEVLQELEVGAIWTHYKARDRVNSKFVSMRVLSNDVAADQGVVGEIRQNVQRLARINHPALERILSFEEDNGVWFLITDYNAGSALEDRIKRLSSYSVPVAVGTVIEAGEAIKALHENQVVHGDLSARTIYATATEGVKVTMPGFWAAYGHSSRAAVRVLKSMAPYLAPEVSSGSMPSVESDIYALGVVLWQLLSGRLPFPGDTPAAIAAKHLNSPYPSARTVMASVPMPLDEIVRKCMAKRPEDRYRSVQMFLDDLRTLLDALRFGRPLTWPLQHVARAPAPGRIAPQMNVANPRAKDPEPAVKNQPSEKVKQRESTDGLHPLVSWVGYIVLLGLIGAAAAWFKYNGSKPKAVIMPNEVGKQYTQAKKDFDAINLSMRVTGRKSDNKYPSGAVISTNPAPGEEARVNNFVDVIISDGSNQIQVPNLRGKSVAEARNLLERMNLEVSQDFEYVADPKLDKDYVAGQRPATGKSVEKFAKIKLLIANGEHAESTPTGLYQKYRVRIPIPAGDKDVQVKILKTDDSATDEVIYDESHSAGETVVETFKGYGPKVKFDIYLDGQLVKSMNVEADPIAATAEPTKQSVTEDGAPKPHRRRRKPKPEVPPMDTPDGDQAN